MKELDTIGNIILTIGIIGLLCSCSVNKNTNEPHIHHTPYGDYTCQEMDSVHAELIQKNEDIINEYEAW